MVNFKNCLCRFICIAIMLSLTQAAVHAIFKGNDGYATGSRDSTVKLWDFHFNELTTIQLANGPYGYKGKLSVTFATSPD